ncbi:MAG TPA: hypothetical protein VJR29_05595 [bacterium]|nr:hypothetical protein [bacterium]
MSKRLTFWISLLTSFGLMLTGLLYLFGLLVALNGVPEKQGMVAIGLWLILHLGILLASAFLALRLARLLITKAAWGSGLTLCLSVFAAVLLGAGASFFAALLSILLAGIR